MLLRLAFCVLTFVGIVSTQNSFVDQLSDTTEGQTGILYGEDHVFSLTAPKGWVIDNASGVSQGLHAVFYPEGGSWQKSSVVMYGKGSSKDVKAHQTIQQFIAYDSSNCVADIPSVKILYHPSLPTRQGKMAIVREFLYSQYEIIAYVDEPTIVAMIVLTASTKDAFENALPAFEKLVYSYTFISDNKLAKVTSFSTASEAADDNIIPPEGKRYDEEVGRDAASWLSQATLNCVSVLSDSGLSDSDLTPFTVLIRVSIDGRAEEVLIKPITRVSECMESAFRAAPYLKPPGPSWWVRMNISFEDK